MYLILAIAAALVFAYSFAMGVIYALREEDFPIEYLVVMIISALVCGMAFEQVLP